MQMADTGTRCLAEGLAAGTGCRYTLPKFSQLTYIVPNRYTVIYDIGRIKYIAEDSWQILWPHLQFQYHSSGSMKPLNWVEGTFHE